VDSSAEGFAGGAFDGRYLYLFPRENDAGWHGYVTRYDVSKSFTEAASWEVYGIHAVDGGAKGFGGGVFDGRYILLVPYYNGAAYHGHVARFDTGSPSPVIQSSVAGAAAPGDCGDVIYKGAAALEALTADAGDGYNVLVSQGYCNPPKWENLIDLVTYLTGALNRLILKYLSIIVPSISVITATASAAAKTATPSESVPVPTIAETAVASSATPKTATPSESIPVPTISASAVIV
jgi:hypothetical protein